MRWLQFGPGMPKIFVTLLGAGALLCVTAPLVQRRVGGAGLAAWCAVAAILLAFAAGPMVGQKMDLGRDSGPLVLFCLLAPPFAAAGTAVYRPRRSPSSLARMFPIAMTAFVLAQILTFAAVLAVLVATIPQIHH